jgi:mRNA interferase MazF
MGEWVAHGPMASQPLAHCETRDHHLSREARPCLLLTSYPADDELALITILPHTTAFRGNHWELAIPKPFLKPGAFHLQQI